MYYFYTAEEFCLLSLTVYTFSKQYFAMRMDFHEIKYFVMLSLCPLPDNPQHFWGTKLDYTGK